MKNKIRHPVWVWVAIAPSSEMIKGISHGQRGAHQHSTVCWLGMHISRSVWQTKHIHSQRCAYQLSKSSDDVRVCLYTNEQHMRHMVVLCVSKFSLVIYDAVVLALSVKTLWRFVENLFRWALGFDGMRSAPNVASTCNMKPLEFQTFDERWFQLWGKQNICVHSQINLPNCHTFWNNGWLHFSKKYENTYNSISTFAELVASNWWIRAIVASTPKICTCLIA